MEQSFLLLLIIMSAGADAKLQGRKMADEYGWDVTEARKIWAFGPEGTGPNLFV